MDNIDDYLSELVHRGFLPIAFENSAIKQLDESDDDANSCKIFYELYQQYAIPNAVVSGFICNYYEIL